MWGWFKRKPEEPDVRAAELHAEEQKTAEGRTQLYNSIFKSQDLIETVKKSLELMEPKK